MTAHRGARYHHIELLAPPTFDVLAAQEPRRSVYHTDQRQCAAVEEPLKEHAVEYVGQGTWDDLYGVVITLMAAQTFDMALGVLAVLAA